MQSVEQHTVGPETKFSDMRHNVTLVSKHQISFPILEIECFPPTRYSNLAYLS